MSEEKLLYEEMYQKTQDFGRTQFVKLLQQNQIKIKQLQQENQRLKQWDINKDTRNSRQRVANAKLIKENKELKDKINNFNLEIDKWLSNSKAEMREYGDNHEKYWEMFNRLLMKIKNKLVDISDYAVIDREREEELLNKENILAEFEKWLEEKTKITKIGLNGFEEYQKCLNKLQELKRK